MLYWGVNRYSFLLTNRWGSFGFVLFSHHFGSFDSSSLCKPFSSRKSQEMEVALDFSWNRGKFSLRKNPRQYKGTSLKHSPPHHEAVCIKVVAPPSRDYISSVCAYGNLTSCKKGNQRLASLCASVKVSLQLRYQTISQRKH